jgi:hypothetical protein
VIAATHQNLEALVADGRFRADLLHRLDVVRLQLPPLRERRGDVAQLAENFLAIASRKLGAPAKRFALPALEALRAYDWPGNVRELENVVERLAAMAPAETITAFDLQGALSTNVAAAAPQALEWHQVLAAWAHARLVNCQSNMRQLGQALVMYANENNGWLIPVNADETAPGGVRGFGSLWPVEERWPARVFKIKGPQPPTSEVADYTPRVLICPADLDAASAHTYALNNPPPSTDASLAAASSTG